MTDSSSSTSDTTSESGNASHGGGRPSPRALAIAAVVLAVVGVVALTLGIRGHSGPPQPAAAGSVSSVGPTVSASTPAGAPTTTRRTAPAQKAATPSAPITSRFLGASAPTSIEVSGSNIRSTTFVPLTIASDGTITVPGTAQEVGLYQGGPTPGQLGPAVLAAHVDSKEGPGVFYTLGATKVGDTIKVGRADGKTAVFTVDKVGVYPKDQFPTDLVYGDYSAASIRLVTCGGVFDRVKHYLSNVVVFGHLTSVQ